MVIDTNEVCDDGNVISGDGCRSDCGKVERCGDGVIDDGEGCDDGNDNPRDGCAAWGQQRWSNTLIVSGAVEIGLAEGLAVIIAYPAPAA